MSEREDVEADEREDLLHALGPCTQCGKPFTKRACGIAHAIISGDPMRHRLLEPFLRRVRAEAWDEGWVALREGQRATVRGERAAHNPYRDFA